MVQTTTDRDTEIAANTYELMLILEPELRESEVKKKLKEITDMIEKTGGKITQEDFWGKKSLAYRLSKHWEGIYAVFNFEFPNNFLRELKEHLRLEKEVLRSMILKLPSGYTYTKYDLEVPEEKEKKPKKWEPKKKTFVPKEETSYGGKKVFEVSRKVEVPKKAEEPKEKEEVAPIKIVRKKEVIEEEAKVTPEVEVPEKDEGKKKKGKELEDAIGSILTRKEEKEAKTKDKEEFTEEDEKKKSDLDKKLDRILEDVDLNL